MPYTGLLLRSRIQKSRQEPHPIHPMTESSDPFGPMILIVERNDPIVRMNPQFRETFGHDENSITSRPLADWLHVEDREAFVNASADRGFAVARLQTKDKQWAALEWRISLDRNGNLATLGLLKNEAHDSQLPPARSKRTYSSQILETLDTMARIVESSNPGLRCSILLVDKEKKVITGGAGPSLSPEYNKAVEGLNIGPAVGSCGTAAFWNKPIIVENIQKDPLWRDLREAASQTGVAACWSFPVTGKTGEVYGALALYNHVPSAPTRSQMHGLSVTAKMVAFAVERDAFEAELHQAMQRERDELARSLKAEKEANTLKSNFLSNVSHELRTPLNGIMGLNQLMLETPLSDIQRDFLNTSQKCSNHLLELVDRILDLSKIEAGKVDLDESDFELNACLDQVISFLERQATQKGLTLISRVDSETPSWLRGDHARLRQVLLNLIGNAIKFTETGEVEVKLHSEPAVGGKIKLRVSVRDTGIGVPKDRQQHIFQNFVQADESTTRQFGGTGLGLAISKQIVEMMGGKIAVESEPDRGSTFSFFVLLDPCVDAYQEAAVEKTSSITPSQNSATASPTPNRESHQDGSPEQSEAPSTKPRVLLVEDNEINTVLTVQILANLGCEVACAKNGQEAIELLENESFALVLMDIQMPTMDGLESTRRIRKREHDTGEHLPIIALTARAMLGDKEKCLEAGMDGYLSKPIILQELREEVEKWTAGTRT